MMPWSGSDFITTAQSGDLVCVEGEKRHFQLGMASDTFYEDLYCILLVLM